MRPSLTALLLLVVGGGLHGSSAFQPTIGGAHYPNSLSTSTTNPRHRKKAFRAVATAATAASFECIIDIDENAPRDVYTMMEWAEQAGVQKADGFQLIPLQDDTEGRLEEYGVVTAQDLPAGSPVLFVPNHMILSSNSNNYDDSQMNLAEKQLVEAGLLDDGEISLFRLFVQILVEYDKGAESPYYAWLDALPRRYNNGAAMTYACFDCLPPYVALLAKEQRATFKKFHKMLHYVPFIDGILYMDRHLVKFAYNVAVTRSFDGENEEKRIVPVAEMFNHGPEANVEVTFDEEGNCMVYANRDIPAGSALEICLGDSTNPSPLFAKYGFLDESSPGTFCKLMHLQEEMCQLGLVFTDLLFYKTGDISVPVWDLVLYSVLADDFDLQQGFYQAYMSGDSGTKDSYHQEYFRYTLQALQKHVDGTLRMLDKLSERAQSYEPSTHPRVPIILKHNDFVKSTFLNVKENLDAMAIE
eukprot:scaffold2385_cov178-Amphora_coffeaeformis.AAC.11